jgi:hypothetical protein
MPNSKLESTELVASSCHRVPTLLRLYLTRGNARHDNIKCSIPSPRNSEVLAEGSSGGVLHQQNLGKHVKM